MRIKIKKGNVVLEVEDDVKRESYAMNGHDTTVDRTVRLTKELIDEFIRLDSGETK